MTKPIVFNYQDHERVLEENRKLKEDIANLQIRCRIAESEPVANDRHCEDCKHMKHGECSRWDCEYEPKLDLIRREDAIEVVAEQMLFEAQAESPYVSDDDKPEYIRLAEELLEDIPSVNVKGEPT